MTIQNCLQIETTIEMWQSLINT